MNTDGLNLSSSIRGKADQVAPQTSAKSKGQNKDGREPQEFSQVLQAKSSPSPVAPKDTKVQARQAEKMRDSRRTETQDELPSVKERNLEKLEKPTAKKKAGSEREQAMLDFMDSMESELGIPPQRMVEAMALLPDNKMLQTPEDSASQVIDQLDLPPEQAELAYSKYMGLLGQLSQMQAPAQSPAVALVAQQQAQNAALGGMNAQTLSARDKREILNDSLDRMNQRFFMQGPNSFQTAQKISDPMSMRSPGEGLMDRLNAAQTPIDGRSQFNAEAMNPKVDTSLLQQQQYSRPTNAMSPEQAQAMQSQMQKADGGEIPPELLAKLSALGASAAALGQSVQKTPSGRQMIDAQEGQGPAGASNFQVSGLGASALSALQGKSSGEMSDDADFGSSDSETGFAKSDALGTKGELGGLHGQDHQLGFREALQTAGGSAAAGQTRNPDQAQNMQKLMDQAQMIVRKGGGEAVVKLNPEGLGEVSMKVVVKDGRVNLEMTASSKEAKKLIEESIGDLKMGLGAHKLAMDSVKVDVGNDAKSGLNQQQQQNPRQDLMNQQNREQARQFFQNFRDENMGKREPFFEMPGIKAYGRPQQGPPALTEASRSERRAVVDGRGERMNLVA